MDRAVSMRLENSGQPRGRWRALGAQGHASTVLVLTSVTVHPLLQPM